LPEGPEALRLLAITPHESQFDFFGVPSSMMNVITHAMPNRNKIQARAIKNGWRRFEEMMSH